MNIRKNWARRLFILNAWKRGKLKFDFVLEVCGSRMEILFDLRCANDEGRFNYIFANGRVWLWVIFRESHIFLIEVARPFHRSLWREKGCSWNDKLWFFEFETSWMSFICSKSCCQFYVLYCTSSLPTATFNFKFQTPNELYEKIKFRVRFVTLILHVLLHCFPSEENFFFQQKKIFSFNITFFFSFFLLKEN